MPTLVGGISCDAISYLFKITHLFSPLAQVKVKVQIKRYILLIFFSLNHLCKNFFIFHIAASSVTLFISISSPYHLCCSLIRWEYIWIGTFKVNISVLLQIFLFFSLKIILLYFFIIKQYIIIIKKSNTSELYSSSTPLTLLLQK